MFNPTEQAVEFKQLEERLNEQVHLLKLEAARGKENEDNLLKINGVLHHPSRSYGIRWSPCRPN